MFTTRFFLFTAKVSHALYFFTSKFFMHITYDICFHAHDTLPGTRQNETRKTSGVTKLEVTRKRKRKTKLPSPKLASQKTSPFTIQLDLGPKKTKNEFPWPEVSQLEKENENEWLKKVRSFVLTCPRESTILQHCITCYHNCN